jgi:phosphatidate cytidylyltransferase
MPSNSANAVSAQSRRSRAIQNNLVQRILSAGALLPVLALPVWAGGSLLLIVAVVAVFLTLYELYHIFAHAGYRPRSVGYVCAVLFVLAAGASDLAGFDLTGLAMLFAVVATLTAELPREERGSSLLTWALTLSGAVYIGWPIAHFVLLRDLATPLREAPLSFLGLESGAAWIVLAMVITFASDTTAYFVGRTWGRRQMAPYISPKKSWEGALGGLLGAFIVGALLVPLLGLPIGIATGAVVGAVGSVAGQIGDLAESLIKRQVGVKDSGYLIPGHGGLLDRADSLLFTVPIVYYLARWLTA